jgi:hypothetical protein
MSLHNTLRRQSPAIHLSVTNAIRYNHFEQQDTEYLALKLYLFCFPRKIIALLPY